MILPRPQLSIANDQSTLVAMSSPLVSISGVRGMLGESFTEELVRQWAAAFAKFIGEQHTAGDARSVLGRDTRPSGAWAIESATRTMVTSGVQPIIVGIAPTPTVARAVRHHRAAGGLIITASHNPGAWNGLKFVGPDGVFLDAQEMEALHRVVMKSRARVSSSRMRGSVGANIAGLRVRGDDIERDDAAIARHVKSVLALPIDAERIRARKFRVVVDPVNGTGAIAVPPLLERLGCAVLMVNGEPNGQFAHPPEPTPANLAELGKRVGEEHADLGFAVDPDADRLVLVDETGTVISEEYTVALAILSVLTSVRAKAAASTPERSTPGEISPPAPQSLTDSGGSLRTPHHDAMAVVVNLSTTRMVDDVAREFGARVVRTAVGERHVIDGMRRHRALIGGEGNGGVIFPQSHEGRDALVGIALVLDLLARRNTSLTRLTRELPQYLMEKEKLPRSAAFAPEALARTLRRNIPGARLSTLDGVRVDTADGWAHVRPSNTEPIVRLIGEARTAKALSSLLAVARDALRVTT